MRRREFVTGLGCAAAVWTGCALAQTDKINRLAVLGASSRGLDFVRAVTLPELQKLGYAEGQNLVVDMRSGPPAELPELARLLVASKPSAIFALDGTSVAASRRETTTIPIVMFGADPVELGFAQSLARPGSNITGLVILAPELDAKRLELLHEALPSGRRIAALVDVSAPGSAERHRRVSEVASHFGFALSLIEASGPHAYEEAFAAIQQAGAQALAIGASPQFARDGVRLAELALERHLPTICQWREMAQQGCLLSYGPSRPDLFRRTASFVARLFAGASPGDLPIEQPTSFELVINAKTANVLNLKIPPTLLARADEVIE
jgi:putative ABC transport system substrate-binding protein